MEFSDFLKEMLGISIDFEISNIVKEETPAKVITISLKYSKTYYSKGDTNFNLYDKMPERKWQHLSWFDYKCYVSCSLPRYVDIGGRVRIIETSFAEKNKGYTQIFSRKITEALLLVRVQQTVADLFQTTPHIVRSIMEDSVAKALELRGEVRNFTNISLDEKSYARGRRSQGREC